MIPVRKVVCGISGGVDSSVAALLLKKKGYDVLGVFMRNWDIADETGHCSADRDKDDAEYVCQRIGIPLQEVNFVRHYWNEVFSELIEDYQNGLTPNPDILCNKSIKFSIFYDHATKNLGADAIATGHYARTSFGEDLKYYQENKSSSEKPPEDAFPTGRNDKEFSKENSSSCWFESYCKKERGIHCWTIGQRCHISGLHTAYFVADKDMKTQNILVAPSTNHRSLFSQTVLTNPPYWIHSPPDQLYQENTFDCYFRFQHGKPLVKCTLTVSHKNCLIVSLEEPLRALTPGQFAVFYTEEECLGSARIIRPGLSLWSLNYNICKAQNLSK
ncbi:mitochondrial tRNA-specific 2-thiouridylase 1 isoform X2 [Tachypleus tridentatus]|uniref:mitochondrial tRNA-specific 2-thiouridylase 1 isoform X2 n=1 Tax=Tachypleus tridentatus TaxID=6853 RepID=UPI003FD52608